jgi:muramoyltetrapeptide carboxypeptidase
MSYSRRNIIGGAAAIAAAPFFSGSASGETVIAGRRVIPNTPIKPPRLRPGDTVGIIEPASASDDAFDVQLVEEMIRAMGLVPKRWAKVKTRFGYFSGPDADRAAEINAMFADKDVRGIFCVRGGWGAARTLPMLDYGVIRANPKMLIGYSDITALHMGVQARTGLTTFHGPVGVSRWGAASVDHFKAIVFDGKMPTLANPKPTEDRLAPRAFRTQIIQSGKASGRLLGGNLTVLTALAGTPYLPDFTGNILFLEDVDEAEYRIDRMLTQLGQAGVLAKLAGVVFGQCTDCVAKGNEGYGGFTLTQVLEQHLKPLGVPAFQGSWFGHIGDQFTLPVGARAEIDADAGTIRLLEAAVV